MPTDSYFEGRTLFLDGLVSVKAITDKAVYFFSGEFEVIYTRASGEWLCQGCTHTGWRGKKQETCKDIKACIIFCKEHNILKEGTKWRE
jgi:hypothetical protein